MARRRRGHRRQAARRRFGDRRGDDARARPPSRPRARRALDRLNAALQPGNTLGLVWRARLDEHLGAFAVEPLTLRAGRFLPSALALAGLDLIGALLRLLPERDPHEEPVRGADAGRRALDDEALAPALLARFEARMLAECGFALDLSECAATGAREELIYVSPKSGRAVSAEAGAPYRDRLLPLPAFLRERGRADLADDVADAFRLTGYFLERELFAPRGLKLPDPPRVSRRGGVRCRFDKSTEAQQIATTKLSDEEFLAFPRGTLIFEIEFASVVSAVENSEGNLKEADAAEERIIEEMRLLEREAMQGWAERQVEVTEREIRQQTQMHRQGEKTPLAYEFGEIEVLELRYRLESKSVRAFLRSAKVIPGGCSRALQRAITDFAADEPFCSGADEVQGAFWLGDRREHDPEDQLWATPKKHLRSEPNYPRFS